MAEQRDRAAGTPWVGGSRRAVLPAGLEPTCSSKIGIDATGRPVLLAGALNLLAFAAVPLVLVGAAPLVAAAAGAARPAPLGAAGGLRAAAGHRVRADLLGRAPASPPGRPRRPFPATNPLFTLPVTDFWLRRSGTSAQQHLAAPLGLVGVALTAGF